MDVFRERKTAIVAEGGGQRGIFTAGVLDAFLENRFNPFEIAIGTSAGAQNVVSYLLGKRGIARRVISELTTRSDFYVPYRWLLAKNIVDLDNYFDHFEKNREFKLPLDRLDTILQTRQLLLTATDSASFDSVYLEPNGSTAIKCMKASSAVPLLYRDQVTINGQALIDGSVAAPVPVEKAYAMGATDIVVIRTLSKNADHMGWRRQWRRAFGKRAFPGPIANMLLEYEKNYTESLRFIERPPADVNIYEIAPSNALRCRAFGSTSHALLQDYAAGFQEGCNSMQGKLRMLNHGTQDKESACPFSKTSESMFCSSAMP